jgi:hypothetical protein
MTEFQKIFNEIYRVDPNYKMNDNVFKALVKVGSLWVNTLIDNKFVIVSNDNDRIVCRTASKLKRGHTKTPVEFALPKTLFIDYMIIKKDGVAPTFLKVR